MDETTLLKSARKLDQGALTTIFDTYAPAVYRYSFRLYLDPVESDSIVGDVFAQFLENLAAGQGPVTNLRSYIFQITYHVIHTHVGGGWQGMMGKASNKIEHGWALTAARSDSEEQFLRCILAALKKDLSDIQRHVLLLRYLEEFSLNETALIVGKTVGNVKIIQNRALIKLKRSLGSYLEDDQRGLIAGVDA